MWNKSSRVPHAKLTLGCFTPGHGRACTEQEGDPPPFNTRVHKCGVLTGFSPPLAALVAVVPKDKLTLNGPTKSWAGKGSSGKDVHRIFCSECGSPIAHDPDAAPEIIALKAGTLDTEIKKTLKPDTEIWTKSKLPFMKETLAKPFEGMPE